MEGQYNQVYHQSPFPGPPNEFFGRDAMTMAPQHGAAAYHHKPYDDNYRGGGCATCCVGTSGRSCFFHVLVLAFLAVGIVLIVAASVFANKCNSICGGYSGNVMVIWQMLVTHIATSPFMMVFYMLALSS
ncbi:hypothetical protein BGW37DRAFT_480788 [Umbelopsis sp. PMI_123]|nr:hypothetical protein BGW37DRAFT_480788 [Umbelopsis sp. PMI_123]